MRVLEPILNTFDERASSVPIAASRRGCQTDHVDLTELLSRPQLRPGEARLPWGDQEFSTRMLAEHLDDRHDMASRRGSLIDRHVAWLSTLAPHGHRVLDLGCGWLPPGVITARP